MRLNLSTLFLAGGLLAGNASAFQQPSVSTRARTIQKPLAMYTDTTVDITEQAQRDVYTAEEWARSCGVQLCEGWQLTSQDGEDWSVMTNQDIPANSPILYVPAEMVLSSSTAQQEFGANLGLANEHLANAGMANQWSLFLLFVKILQEFENGDQSPYFPWFNSLPRRFYNGVAMTYACFECLPPYVSYLSQKERGQFVQFQKALNHVPLGEETLRSVARQKWAYNVALTRSTDIGNGERRLAPMADMFNHGMEPEVEVYFDEQGNCNAYATRDIPAGSPLRVSLGDPTNPSPLFATYGFLAEDTPCVFAKTMHLQNEMKDLKIGFSNMLFYNTGDISPEVYDVFLYRHLYGDPNLPGFYEACMRGDEETKSQYHGEYFPYTLAALREHVDSTLREVDQLSALAASKDVTKHPRVPVILQHNDFVKDTFLRVKAVLDSMG